jgi:hypothetical protein
MFFTFNWTTYVLPVAENIGTHYLAVKFLFIDENIDVNNKANTLFP